VAIHRKVHLFDIDIPGKIKFKVAYIHGFYMILSHPDSGKRDADWWLERQLFRYGHGILRCRSNSLLIFASIQSLLVSGWASVTTCASQSFR
jgi:hypothetical protein